MGQWYSFINWLGAFTFADIWRAGYQLPTPNKLALLVVVLALYTKDLQRWWKDWKLSRKVVQFQWSEPKEADPNWTGRVIQSPHLSSHLDDDTLLPPETGKTGATRSHITCYDPATGYHLTTVPLFSSDEVTVQIKRGHDAQEMWAQTSFAQRKSLLRSLKRWVMRDMAAIVRVACRDTGKTGVDAVFGEILTTISKIDWLLKHGEKTLSPKRRPGNLLLMHKISTVHYVPLGSTLACVSWNYSFHNVISPILASLFAGNTVVVKCSEQVAWSSMWYVGGVRACLRACGLEEDVVQLVICLPEVAETVTRNRMIRHITFIGSEPVGRKVAVAAAESMIPTCMELGGKDPALILSSADLDCFASTLLRGVFQSAGQNCIGIELILLPRPLLAKYISIMAPRIRSLRPGVDVGSLISHKPISRLTNLLASATQSGARIIVGGKQYRHADHPEGAYFEPTLITDVTMDMDIATEELFAPIMTVVCYDTLDEAVRWLNDSRFGLGAGVYGADRLKCERVAERLQCGMVSINDFGVFYLNQASPFGGVKASGHGRFGGEEGLRSLCSTKTIIQDRFFSYIRTSIPRPVDFPLPDQAVWWPFLCGLVKLAYSSSLVNKARGLRDMLKTTIRSPRA